MSVKPFPQAHMHPRDDETLALVCGPPPMVEKAVVPALEALGFDESHLVIFLMSTVFGWCTRC